MGWLWNFSEFVKSVRKLLLTSRHQRNDAYPPPGILKTTSDLTNLFLDYLHSKILKTPFSEGPLDPESVLILPQLERLNKRGWWTVGSQPAVDGASSAAPTFGWGPRSGWVFQKAFVEFFCETEDANEIERVIAEKGKGWVSYLMANEKGEFRGNLPEDGRNAVTWGVFPGHEIQQSTIIERESFATWKVRCTLDLMIMEWHSRIWYRRKHLRPGRAGHVSITPTRLNALSWMPSQTNGGLSASCTTITRIPMRSGIFCLIRSLGSNSQRR